MPPPGAAPVPAPPSRPPGSAYAGLNRVSTQALTSLAQAAAGAELGIRPGDVRADWSDDAGLLALRIVAPIAIPDLSAAGAPVDVPAWGGSVWERCAMAKGRILESVSRLSGATLSRVDIRVSGIRTERRPAVLGRPVEVLHG
jgi:hypothetical protein